MLSVKDKNMNPKKINPLGQKSVGNDLASKVKNVLIKRKMEQYSTISKQVAKKVKPLK
jgi:hypothetical protein